MFICDTCALFGSEEKNRIDRNNIKIIRDRIKEKSQMLGMLGYLVQEVRNRIIKLLEMRGFKKCMKITFTPLA